MMYAPDRPPTLSTHASSRDLQQHINSLGLPTVPRSASALNLGASGEARSGSSTPNAFLRASAASAGPSASGSASPLPHVGAHSSHPAPASPRSSQPPLHHHHSNYDARLVANTINRIEYSTGIGAAGHAVAGAGAGPGAANTAAGSGAGGSSTLGGSAAGTGSAAGQGTAGDGKQNGTDSDSAWTAACIRTLPLL